MHNYSRDNTKLALHTFLIIFLMLGASSLFVWLYCLVYTGGNLCFDEQALLFFYQIQSPVLNIVVLGITHTATYLVTVPIVIIVIYLWKRGEKKLAIFPVISFVLFLLLSLLLKAVVSRPRPSIVLPVIVEPLFSFPSGHVMIATGVYGLISLLLWQRKHKKLSVLSAIWVVLIAFSRVYLGVHYPSDVLGSLFLGFVFLGIVYWIDSFFITGRVQSVGIN